MILWPAASMALARARTSKADSVPSRSMRSASRKFVMAPMINLGRFGGKSLECRDLVILPPAPGHVTLEFAEYKEVRDVRWHAGAAPPGTVGQSVGRRAALCR